MARPSHTRLAATRARLLRRELTIAEAHLWGGLKNRATGARFRRQVPIGIYIVDFAALRPRLALEIDDDSHELKDETERTQYITSRGFALLRFTNHEIYHDVNAALATVANWVAYLEKHGRPPPE